jgi:hypothetical protein
MVAGLAKFCKRADFAIRLALKTGDLARDFLGRFPHLQEEHRKLKAEFMA